MSRALYVLLPDFGFPLAFNLHSDARILLVRRSALPLRSPWSAACTPCASPCAFRRTKRCTRAEPPLPEDRATDSVSASCSALQLGICFVVLVCCGLLTRTALNIFIARYRLRPGQLPHRKLRPFAVGIQRRTRPRLSNGTPRSPAQCARRCLAPLSPRICPWATWAPAIREISDPRLCPRQRGRHVRGDGLRGPDFFRTMGIRLAAGPRICYVR